jgi:hypothetical protein
MVYQAKGEHEPPVMLPETPPEQTLRRPDSGGRLEGGSVLLKLGFGGLLRGRLIPEGGAGGEAPELLGVNLVAIAGASVPPRAGGEAPCTP